MDEIQEMKMLIKAIYQIMDDGELMKAVSRMYRRLYLNLIEEGFTSDQAMQILTKFEFGKK